MTVLLFYVHPSSSLFTPYQILRRLPAQLMRRAECGIPDYYYPKSALSAKCNDSHAIEN